MRQFLTDQHGVVFVLDDDDVVVSCLSIHRCASESRDESARASTCGDAFCTSLSHSSSPNPLAETEPECVPAIVGDDISVSRKYLHQRIGLYGCMDVCYDGVNCDYDVLDGVKMAFHTYVYIM